MSEPMYSTDSIPKDARTWAMACHLMALTGLITAIGFIAGPLVTWLVKKDEHPFIDEQGKEALNFQLTMMIAMLCCIPLIFVVIGILLLPVLGILNLVFTIIATVSAANGEHYHYPVSIKFFQ